MQDWKPVSNRDTAPKDKISYSQSRYSESGYGYTNPNLLHRQDFPLVHNSTFCPGSAAGCAFGTNCSLPKKEVSQSVSGAIQARPLLIVVSYAKEDRKRLDVVLKHLSTLIDEGKVEIWYDEHLDGRTNWDETIKEKFNKADAYLVLISPIYMYRERKKYIHREEVPIMLERHNRLQIPVYCITIEPVDCGTIINSFYHFDKKTPMPARGAAQGKYMLRFVNEVIRGKLLKRK
jgi:hypothetical protein